MPNKPPSPTIEIPATPNDQALKEAIFELLSTHFKKSQLHAVEMQLAQSDNTDAEQRTRLMGISNFRYPFRRRNANALNKQNIDPNALFRSNLNQHPMSNVYHPISGATLTIPQFFEKLCNRLLVEVRTKGIFRLAGSTGRQKAMMENIAQHNYSFGSCSSLDLASIAKRFIRNIPGGLIPSTIRILMMTCADLKAAKNVPQIPLYEPKLVPSGSADLTTRIWEPRLFNYQQPMFVEGRSTMESQLLLLCLLMPKLNRDLLIYLLTILLEVSKAKEWNGMSFPNIMIIFGPTIFNPECSAPIDVRNCVEKQSRILSVLFANIDKIGKTIPSLEEKLKEIKQRKVDTDHKSSRVLRAMMSNIANGFKGSSHRSHSTTTQKRTPFHLKSKNATNSSQWSSLRIRKDSTPFKGKRMNDDECISIQKEGTNENILTLGCFVDPRIVDNEKSKSKVLVKTQTTKTTTVRIQTSIIDDNYQEVPTEGQIELRSDGPSILSPNGKLPRLSHRRRLFGSAISRRGTGRLYTTQFNELNGENRDGRRYGRLSTMRQGRTRWRIYKGTRRIANRMK
ncbi:hypothetical protein ACOME3_001909 [Neoechinorhynchus agilis]